MTKRIVLTLIVIGIVLTLPFFVRAVLQARHEARTVQCRNELKQIVLALHNYHDTCRKMPPARLIDHSWRIRVNPFRISSPYYDKYRFEEAWNSDWNRTLEFKDFPVVLSPDGIPTKRSPADDALGEADFTRESMASWHWHCSCEQRPSSPHTNYLMIVGENAFGLPDDGRNLRDITDDHSMTIAVAETLSQEISWLEPKDFDVETMSFQINDPNPDKLSISSHHPDGPLVGMVDGSVRQLSPDLPPEVLKAMITINGGETIVADETALGGYRLEK